MIHQLVTEYLEKIRQQGLERRRNGQLLHEKRNASDHLSARGDGKKTLNFSSNDYLGLTETPSLKEAFQRSFACYSAGSGGSMVISGCHPNHRKLERMFAEAYNVDDALLFSSGYAANLGIVSLLAKLNVHLILDKASHASLYDGLKLSSVSYSRFKHNDPTDLAKQLKRQSAQGSHAGIVVITEGIFSMSGQKAPLSSLYKLCQKFQAVLIVDEAHSFGILGPQGLGAVAGEQYTQKEVPLRMIAFGKAMGCQGAIVLGPQGWVDALLQASRAYIYSTAMSPALAGGLLEAFLCLQKADKARETLSGLIEYFNHKIESSCLLWSDSITPIQQLRLGCPYTALIYTEQLLEKGIFCQALRWPTVSKKSTGLRVILTASHTMQDIDFLFDALHRIHENLAKGARTEDAQA